MKSKQLYFVLLTTAVLLALGLGGVAYGSNKVLSAKARQLGDIKARNQAIEQVQASLSKSKTDLTKYKTLNEIAAAVVPQDKDQTQTVREIVKIATDSGIPSLSSVTFPASTLGAVGKTGSALTQATPVPGITGVYTIPITVTLGSDSAVPYSKLIAFLKGLEQNRRTSQVTNLVLQPSDKNPDLISFTITINEYIKP